MAADDGTGAAGAREAGYNPRMPPARKLATFADMLPLEEDGLRVEIVDGEIVEKSAATFDHGVVQSVVASRIFPYRRRAGSPPPSGWWFGTEVDIQFELHQVFRPDIAGWRRERVVEQPKDFPTLVTPDWVCEVLSTSTAKRDLGKKKDVYFRHNVEHYWTVDPERRLFTVYRRTEAGYLVALTAEPGQRVRAEPFDLVELDVGEICGLDAMESET